MSALVLIPFASAANDGGTAGREDAPLVHAILVIGVPLFIMWAMQLIANWRSAELPLAVSPAPSTALPLNDCAALGDSGDLLQARSSTTQNVAQESVRKGRSGKNDLGAWNSSKVEVSNDTGPDLKRLVHIFQKIGTDFCSELIPKEPGPPNFPIPVLLQNHLEQLAAELTKHDISDGHASINSLSLMCDRIHQVSILCIGDWGRVPKQKLNAVCNALCSEYVCCTWNTLAKCEQNTCTDDHRQLFSHVKAKLGDVMEELISTDPSWLVVLALSCDPKAWKLAKYLYSKKANIDDRNSSDIPSFALRILQNHAGSIQQVLNLQKSEEESHPCHFITQIPRETRIEIIRNIHESILAAVGMSEVMTSNSSSPEILQAASVCLVPLIKRISFSYDVCWGICGNETSNSDIVYAAKLGQPGLDLMHQQSIFYPLFSLSALSWVNMASAKRIHESSCMDAVEFALACQDASCRVVSALTAGTNVGGSQPNLFRFHHWLFATAALHWTNSDQTGQHDGLLLNIFYFLSRQFLKSKICSFHCYDAATDFVDSDTILHPNSLLNQMCSTENSSDHTFKAFADTVWEFLDERPLIDIQSWSNSAWFNVTHSDQEFAGSGKLSCLFWLTGMFIKIGLLRAKDRLKHRQIVNQETFGMEDDKAVVLHDQLWQTAIHWCNVAGAWLPCNKHHCPQWIPQTICAVFAHAVDVPGIREHVNHFMLLDGVAVGLSSVLGGNVFLDKDNRNYRTVSSDFEDKRANYMQAFLACHSSAWNVHLRAEACRCLAQIQGYSLTEEHSNGLCPIALGAVSNSLPGALLNTYILASRAPGMFHEKLFVRRHCEIILSSNAYSSSSPGGLALSKALLTSLDDVEDDSHSNGCANSSGNDRSSLPYNRTCIQLPKQLTELGLDAGELFVHEVISDLGYVYEEVSSRAWAVKNGSTGMEDTIEAAQRAIRTFSVLLSSSLRLILLLSENSAAVNVMMTGSSGSLRLQTVDIVNRILAELIFDSEKLLGADDIVENSFLEWSANIAQVFGNLCGYEWFVTSVLLDGRSFEINRFSRLPNTLLLPPRSRANVEKAAKFWIREVGEPGTSTQSDDATTSLTVPDEFVDPITAAVMTRPCVLPSSQMRVDRSTIQRHLMTSATDPFNRQPLKLSEVTVDHELASRIQQWQRDATT